MAKETEIRAFIQDPETVQNLLYKRGFQCQGEVLHIDLILDHPDAQIFNSGRKLRIRLEGDKVELTYKGYFEGDTSASRRIEESVSFPKEDLNSLISIFSALGFPPLFTIPKRRTTFTDGATLVTFDDWPIIGCLLELEGEESAVIELAQGVAPSVEFSNYRLKDLFLRAEQETGRSLEDLQEEYERTHNVNLGRLDLLLS
jgi:predicted adenylyl cyclase CyaB